MNRKIQVSMRVDGNLNNKHLQRKKSMPKTHKEIRKKKHVRNPNSTSKLTKILVYKV